MIILYVVNSILDSPGGHLTVGLILVKEFRAVLECSNENSSIIAEFKKLSSDPRDIKFLPTMPQDDTVEVTQAVGGVTSWFECNCGNIYGIGDCGRPLEWSSCPHCNAPLQTDKFDGTNKTTGQTEVVQFKDRTQKGHILGEAQLQGNAAAIGERGLSCLEVQVTR